MDRYQLINELLEVARKYDKKAYRTLQDNYINILTREIEQIDIELEQIQKQREEAQKNFTLNF